MSDTIIYKCCQLCDPFRPCNYATDCKNCGMTFCTLCYPNHVSSCKAIVDGKLNECNEHNSLIFMYCVQCNKLCCSFCKCKEQDHSTVYLRDAYDSISVEIQNNTQYLDSRVKQEESFLENVIEIQKELLAKQEKIKDMSTAIQKRVKDVENSLQQKLQVKFAKIDKVVRESEHIASALKDARVNLISLSNEHDSIMFLRKWKSPGSICEWHDQFQKTREDHYDRGELSIGKDFDNMELHFSGALNSLLNNTEGEIPMETDTDVSSGQAMRTAEKKEGSVKDEQRNDALKHMLDISLSLQVAVKSLRSADGIREHTKRPRVITAGEYNEYLNTFIGCVDEAQNYMIKLNNDNYRYMYALRELERKDRKPTKGLLDRLFGKTSEFDTYERTRSNYDARRQLQATEERFVMELSLLHHSLDTLNNSNSEKDGRIKNMMKEKDDLQNRLSSLAGDQLTKDNPTITDLSDTNRPMKIGEKYGELYDNEWTDSMELVGEMKELFPDLETGEYDEIVVHHLHKLLLKCFQDCKYESTLQLRAIGFTESEEGQEDTETSIKDSSAFSERSFNLKRRRNADSFAEHLFKEKKLCKDILVDWDYPWKNDQIIKKLKDTPYFRKCVQLCWYMVIQDPMVYLEDELEKGTIFDKTSYKEFVQKGDKVSFVVWPALYLHKGGPLLCKGVVQAYSTK